MFLSTLGVLLLVDAAFAVGHLLWVYGVTVELLGHRINFGENDRISFQDHGYPETWDGIKGVVTAGLFLGCFSYRQQPAYLGLAAIFALPHGDNLFRFHERAGRRLAGALGQDSPLSAHAGELAAFASVGVAVIVILAVTYRLSDAGARKVARIGVGIMVLLAVFAIGTDLVHAAVNAVFAPPRRIDTLLVLIEEGGEMMSISLGLAFSYTTFRRLRARAQAE